MHRAPNIARRGALASAGAALALALGACSAPDAVRQETGERDDAGTVSDRVPEAQDEPQEGEGSEGSEGLASEVDRIVSSMTLEQKVAQLFVVRPEAITGVGTAVAAGEATRQALLDMPVGGIVYFAANLVDADQTREMLRNTAAYSEEAIGLPVFLCVDEEGGTVSRVGGNPGFSVDNVGNMCDVGATGDADYAREVVEHIGTYLSYLGFNVDFAPDADIANNPESETMRLRSFGASADVVSLMVGAQVEGFANTGVLCSAKHFPGIGGAMGDSHDGRIYSEKTLDEIRAEELEPFRAAIRADVPFVMVGHLSVPSVTGDDDPATVSREIVTDLLRDELGYQGIIITDSMAMGAALESLSLDRLGVAPLLAGVDMVLMPEDLQAAYQGVLDAVSTGELTEGRIDESVSRVVRTKLERL